MIGVNHHIILGRISAMTIPPVLVAVAGVAVLIQTALPPDFVGPAERLTLVGVLLIAVKVLWASNAKKDEAIIAMTQKLTESMVIVVESNRELRSSNEKVTTAVETLVYNVDVLLGTLHQRPENHGHPGTSHTGT
jgi:hypothetical protein